MSLDPKLLEILACPACRNEVREVGERIVCTNEECRRAYDVKDDIPVMLIDESTTLDEAEWRSTLDGAGQ